MGDKYEKCNVWYCNPYSGMKFLGKEKPGRAFYLALELMKLGYDFKTITSSFEHINGLKSEFNEDFHMEEHNGISFTFLKVNKYRGNGLARIKNMLAYARQLKRNYRKLINKLGLPKIIICSVQHPFHYFVCNKIAKKCNAKLIFEVRDLWPLSLVEVLGVSRYNPLCLWLSLIERRAYRTADAVVSLLENSAEYMLERGMKKKNFYWIANGYAELDEQSKIDLSCENDYQTLVELKRAKKFLVGYTGSHGKPNNLEILCQAFSQINDNNVLILIGDGVLKAKLVNDYGQLNNVIFFDAKSKKTIPEYLRLFDLVYLGWHNKSLYNYGLSPNKMYEYMFYGKSILQPSIPSNTPVNIAGCGFFFENENVESLKSAILMASQTTSIELEEMGSRAKEIIKNEYLYSKLAKDYAAVFDELVKIV